MDTQSFNQNDIISILPRFIAYRERLFNEIYKEIEENGGYKSYDGELSLQFPGAIEQNGKYSITLKCYSLGPRREYIYEGKTFEEALVEAEKDLNYWVEVGIY